MSTHLILLADDEPHITHIISHKLTRAGYEVVVVEDGEMAFKTALERMPSAIVTDLQMPYLSGIELAQQLYANAKTKDIPIIMLTARGYTVEDEIAKLPSVKKLLSKPFSAKDLLKDIDALLEGGEGMAA
jgi:DNA-binding response OmpR family regulator